MLELLFLLLPVAAAYGWYMGQRSILQNKQDEVNRQSRNYMDGLDFLLSNQKDKAVDRFLDMVKDDSGTFEAHITLGNLFRTRGEVDRAIRIHQSLIESTSITFEQRLLATQQLGRDYVAAGLYDRAEEVFIQLVDDEDFRVDALKYLLTLYQATSEWHKAISTAEKLVKLGYNEYCLHIAHFCCELALQCMGSDDLDNASQWLHKALSADENCARASIMLGRILIAKKDDIQAIHVMEQVLEQDKDFISEVLPLIKECYDRLGLTKPWMELLKRVLTSGSNTIAELLLADMLEQNQGRDVAQLFVNRQIQRHPTTRLFYRLMEYHLSEAEEGRAKESLILLRNMVGEQIKVKPSYRCIKCGFTSHSLYWHCPSCRSWASVKPIRGLDGI